MTFFEWFLIALIVVAFVAGGLIFRNNPKKGEKIVQKGKEVIDDIGDSIRK